MININRTHHEGERGRGEVSEINSVKECIIHIQCGKHFSLDLPLLIGIGHQPCVLLAGGARLVLCASSRWMTAALAVWKNVTAHSASGLMEHESTVKWPYRHFYMALTCHQRHPWTSDWFHLRNLQQMKRMVVLHVNTPKSNNASMETHSNTEFNTIIKVTKSTLKNAVALWISSSVCANAAALSEIQ